MVEFALLVPLLMAAAFAVIQVVLLMHVRASVQSAAAEAARVAAVSAAPQAAARRTAERELSAALGPGRLDRVNVRESSLGGVPVVAVQVSAHARVALLDRQVPIDEFGYAVVEEP